MLLFFEIKEKILRSPILKDYWFVLIIAISVIINAVIWYYLYYQIPLIIEHIGSRIIALHYNIFFQIDYIDDANNLYYNAVLGAAIIIINLMLGIFMYFQAKLLSYFLIISAMLCQIILLFSVYLIILFNK